MIQISYEPAFDALHGIYRALRILAGPALGKRIPREGFRILDYYLLFPDRLETVTVRPEHRRLRTQARKTPRPPFYGPRPDDAVLLERMRPYQDAALETLARQGLLSPDDLEIGWVAAGPTAVPDALAARIYAANETEKALGEALSALVSGYRVEGPGGLKNRTALMEHRYDAV